MDRPYNVYGGLQDNSSWVGESQYPGGIAKAQWENMYGGDGFWMFADPTDPEYVYAEAQGGYIGRVNRKTHETRDITAAAHLQEKASSASTGTRRFTSARHATGRSTSARSFSSARATSARRGSASRPTSRRTIPTKQKQEESGGVTVDNSSAETHTTIFAIGESPKNSHRRSGSAPTTATSRSRATAARSGRTSSATFAALPKNAWVIERRAGSLRCRHDLRHVRPAHVRRHAAVRVSVDRLRQDVDVAHRRGLAGARLRARHQGGSRQSASALPRHRVRTVDLASTAASTGRGTRAAICRTSPCAISRFIRATTIS